MMMIAIHDSKPYKTHPSLHSIADGISEDVNDMVERYEEDNGCVEVTLDYIHGDILILGITAYGTRLPSETIIFTSLNLWQFEEDNYVFNMQDGKVSGFEVCSLKDHNITTPVQFVEHILHDLFYGW